MSYRLTESGKSFHPLTIAFCRRSEKEEFKLLFKLRIGHLRRYTTLTKTIQPFTGVARIRVKKPVLRYGEVWRQRNGKLEQVRDTMEG
jgi:hypothetical protein